MKALPPTGHPVLAAYQHLLDAFGTWARTMDDLAVVVDVGPKGARLLAVPFEDWASPTATHLLPITATPGSNHVRLERVKMEVAIAPLAMAWHAATRAVPGLGDLCGTGMLAAQWEKGKLLLSWTPKARLDVDVDRRLAGIDHPLGPVFRAAMARALGLPKVAKSELVAYQIFESGKTMAASCPYGAVRSTVAQIRAMDPMLTNDAHSTGPNLDIGHGGERIVRDAAFDALLMDAPKTAPALHTSIKTARDAWLAHLDASIPLGLKRIRFFATPQTSMESTHLMDEPWDNDNSAEDAPPFSDADRAWLDAAHAAWATFVAALPAHGLWAAGGIEAYVSIDHVTILDGHDTYSGHAYRSNTRFARQANTLLQGQCMRGLNTTNVPDAWLVRSKGDRYLVQMWRTKDVLRVRARSSQEAAAVAWMATQGTSARRMPAKIWRQD